MKQALVAVPLFLVLVAILYLFVPVFPERISHESFISPEAQIVVTQYDLKDRIAEFSLSPLGQTVAELRYDVVGRELGMTDDEIDQLLRLKDEITKTYHNPLVQMLVSREITIALLPFAEEQPGDFTKQITDNMLVVSRPNRNPRLMDVATWAISSDDRITTARYGVHTITRFDLEDNRRLSVARVKDLVVMSLNERILRQGLDVYDSDTQGLRENEQYRSKIDQFEGASFIGYFNFDGLPDLLNRAILESTRDKSRIRLIDKQRIAAYTSAIFGAWREEDTIVDKAVISIAPETIGGPQRTNHSIEATLPDSYRRVTEDSIVYHWSNQFSPETLISMLENDGSGSRADGHSPILGDLAEITGQRPDQLLDLLENELTLAVRGLDENQLVPLPRFLLSLKSRRVEQLKKAIDEIIDHYEIPVRRKNYNGAEIITWGGIIGISSVLPTLSFTNEAVIVSSSRELISRYIDPQSTQSLADSIPFKDVSADLLKPSNSITYLDFARTAEMLQEMVSWAGTMLAIKDRELARKSKVLIDDLINPLLEGLSMYSIIGSRKYHDGNTIVLESFTRLDHGKQ